MLPVTSNTHVTCNTHATCVCNIHVTRIALRHTHQTQTHTDTQMTQKHSNRQMTQTQIFDICPKQ